MDTTSTLTRSLHGRITLTMRPERVVGGLAVVAAGLVAAGVAGGLLRTVWGHSLRSAVWLFDLSVDAAIPTWYASMTLLLCAALLTAITAVYRGQSDRRAVWYWGGLSVIFLMLSVDEVATIHEWTANLVGDMEGVLYYSWVVFGLAFVAVSGAAYLPFVLRQPARLRWLIIAAGALFVGGALGMEMFNSWLGYYRPEDHLVYMLTTAVEEAMEQAGVLVFLYALLDHLRTLGVRLSVDFGNEARRA